jgi:hypothetical protein
VTLTSTDAEATIASCVLSVQVTTVLTVGEVQGTTLDSENGRADRSPLAPASGNGSSSQFHDVRGVITQRTLARTSAGAAQYGFFLQSRLGATDGNPLTSDGIFVFMGGFNTLIGGYAPTVGDEVVLHARVSEFFNMTQLSSASLVSVLESGLDVGTAVEITDATRPPSSPTRIGSGSGTRARMRCGRQWHHSGRDVFRPQQTPRSGWWTATRRCSTGPTRTPSGVPRHAPLTRHPRRLRQRNGGASCSAASA